MPAHPTAVMAEDEPLLAQALARELHTLWPELQLLATAGDGLSAVALALQHRPDVLWLDIRMPRQSRLDAAAELADVWPDAWPFPLLVFVTAYGEYALQAFDAHAVDYVLKPVQPERLAKTVARLKSACALRHSTAQPSADHSIEPVLAQLRALLQLPKATPAGHPPAAAPLPPLQLLQVSVGKQLRMVPVGDVLWLEAADKYVRVFTHAGDEVLLRTPLKELLLRLDAQQFWQIHRGTVVRASAIEAVTRDEAGRLSLRLKGHPTPLGVSRLFAHLFKAM